MTRRFDFVPLPHLSESSRNWTSHLLSTAQNLANNCKMSLFEVLNTPVSFEADYYASEAWEERKKEMDMEVQRQNALMKMGNEIIKGFNNIGKQRR